jgi:hypothetical protein
MPPPDTLPSSVTGDGATALIRDRSTQQKIPRNGIRVAWIASPKVVPRSGNEATKRLFLINPRSQSKSRSIPDAKAIVGLKKRTCRWRVSSIHAQKKIRTSLV